jgi:hypothetical protein
LRGNTGKGTRSGSEAVLRLVDLASKNRFIDFDHDELHEIRRRSRQQDVAEEISRLTVWLPSSETVWEVTRDGNQ